MPKKLSELEETFALMLRTQAHIPAPIREHRFYSGRQWRFDFAWPDQMLAVEIEGGIWTGGRHTRPKGFQDDCEKYNTAALAGWRVLRFTDRDISNWHAAQVIADWFSVAEGDA